MVCPERKSIESIALNVGDGQVSALQKFVNIAPWDRGDVQVEVQSVFADELVPSAAGSPTGVVGVIDESGFAKKGITAPAWPGSTTADWAKRTTARSGSSWWASPPAARRCW